MTGEDRVAVEGVGEGEVKREPGSGSKRGTGRDTRNGTVGRGVGDSRGEREGDRRVGGPGVDGGSSEVKGVGPSRTPRVRRRTKAEVWWTPEPLVGAGGVPVVSGGSGPLSRVRVVHARDRGVTTSGSLLLRPDTEEVRTLKNGKES